MNNNSKKIFELKERAIAVVLLMTLASLLIARYFFSPFNANVVPVLYSPEKEIAIGILLLLPVVTTIIVRIWYSFKLKKLIKEENQNDTN